MKAQLLKAVVLGALIVPGAAVCQTLDPEMAAKILKGFQIAPVPLNMVGKDTNMVGYGSYLVNAAGDCNGCHTNDPSTEYAPGGNPYFSQHTTVNPATYLGGGQDFGAFPDPAGPFPHIITRNLTPDKTGLAEGGNSLSTFMQIMRTGIDTDHVHPTCTGAPNGKCLPPPFNGDLLQIMPWPTFANMSDYDLQSIYAYLSSIPCIEGGPGEPPNRCAGAFKTTAVAGPKNLTVSSREAQLDGTKSTSADGNPLTYAWSIPQGSPQAAILHGDTATPTVQFTLSGVYMFQLTVTDSKGGTASDMVTVTYGGHG